MNESLNQVISLLNFRKYTQLCTEIRETFGLKIVCVYKYGVKNFS